MFQITELSEVVGGIWKEGKCRTWWVELRPDQGALFETFEVLIATMRYVILRGLTRHEGKYVTFDTPDGDVCLPESYLKQLPIMAQEWCRLG